MTYIRFVRISNCCLYISLSIYGFSYLQKLGDKFEKFKKKDYICSMRFKISETEYTELCRLQCEVVSTFD